MSGKRWTKCEEDFLIKHYNEYTNKEIGKILNKTEKSIEYKKGQLKLTQNINNKNRGDQHFFDTIDSDEKAYWLGFIYADGYICRSDKNYELGIELKSSDIEHLKKFNAIFEGYYEIKTKQRSYKFPTKEIEEQLKTCVIRVYSKTIFEGLVKNNIVQNKTNSDIFPQITDKKMFLSFLRGYIDGDGSYVIRDYKGRQYPKISIVGNNKYMFDYIVTKLKDDFNIHAYICKDRNMYKLQIGRQYDVFKLIDLMFDEANIYLDRKFDKIIEIKNLPSKKEIF